MKRLYLILALLLLSSVAHASDSTSWFQSPFVFFMSSAIPTVLGFVLYDFRKYFLKKLVVISLLVIFAIIVLGEKALGLGGYNLIWHAFIAATVGFGAAFLAEYLIAKSLNKFRPVKNSAISEKFTTPKTSSGKKMRKAFKRKAFKGDAESVKV